MTRLSSRPLRGAALLALVAVWLAAMAAPLVAGAAEVRSQNGISYMSGGIGREDVDSMRAQAGRFNVRLSLISASTGESLSDVLVLVSNSDGKRLLRVVTEGPLLYVRLDAGAYVVTAEYQGQQRVVQVTAGPTPLDFVIRMPVNTLEDDWLYCETRSPRRER
ncbi:hypothetical protein [Cupriavidus campinensis]|uniref:Carboxypeptidase regulatory-like domain-containing protein n=1 Tax=Cupriavidus campinensis TaxID=151783 RepID=A0ABY3ELW4_9BURK|nr:hypothetical protein [Cupriavidus campinensis]TSP11939.1 hypothetical protein FGG12_15555 [Cupriavidus campinensis]